MKIAALALLLAATPLAAAPLTIESVKAALKATTTMTADFSQTAANGTTWAIMRRLAERFIPKARIIHPYPNQRLPV